jgi:hypothetical protein
MRAVRVRRWRRVGRVRRVRRRRTLGSGVRWMWRRRRVWRRSGMGRRRRVWPSKVRRRNGMGWRRRRRRRRSGCGRHGLQSRAGRRRLRKGRRLGPGGGRLRLPGTQLRRIGSRALVVRGALRSDCRRRGARDRRHRRDRRRGRRGRDGLPLKRRPAAVRGRRDHDLLRRRRCGRPRTDRWLVHRAGVEQERHRPCPEQQRDQRYHHPPGGHPEPFASFVGRHRPVLPPLRGSVPVLRGQGYKKPGRTATRFRGIMPCLVATCGAPGRDSTLGA